MTHAPHPEAPKTIWLGVDQDSQGIANIEWCSVKADFAPTMYLRADLRSDLAAVVPDGTLIEGAHGDDYPSVLAMKYAVEMEIEGAFGRVQTQTLGKIIQRAINDALAAATKPPVEQNDGNCPVCNVPYGDRDCTCVPQNKLASTHKPPANAGDEASELLRFMEDECLTLECTSSPTGAGDADVDWRVLSYHMSKPEVRQIAFEPTPIRALRAARAALASLKPADKLKPRP